MSDSNVIPSNSPVADEPSPALAKTALAVIDPQQSIQAASVAIGDICEKYHVLLVPRFVIEGARVESGVTIESTV